MGRWLVIGGARAEDVPSRGAEVLTMAAVRADHSATLLPDGKVLIVRGCSAVNAPPLAELLDPVTETFSLLATPGLASRVGHAAATLPGGDV